MHVYCPTVSVGQKSSNNSAGASISESLTGCSQGVLAGLWSSRRPSEKGLLLPSSRRVGRTQLLVGCWPGATLSSLSRGPRQHGRLLHQSDQAKVAIQTVCSEDRSHRLLKLKHNHSRTSHHLCHVLLVRSKSLGSATLRGRGLHKGLNTRRWKSLRAGLGLPPHSRQSSRPNATLDVLQCWR